MKTPKSGNSAGKLTSRNALRGDLREPNFSEKRKTLKATVLQANKEEADQLCAWDTTLSDGLSE